jgi:hypothetical protein
MPDFSALADDFIAQINAANIQPATEVNLIYHAEDSKGSPLPPHRLAITPATTWKGMGSTAAAQGIAASSHIAAIIGNINSLVRGCPPGPTMMQGFGNQVVTINNIELEIIQP